MYLTQTNVIRYLSKEQYNMLREMCRYSNNLYNYGLYCIRQHYFNTKTFLAYESNYHVCKNNENYTMLQAGVSQQILRVVGRSFKSFFNLIKKAKGGDYRFQDIRIPHYRKKGDLFVLVLQKNSIAISNGFLKIPMSNEFRKSHSGKDILIPFPKRLEGKELKEVRILPCNNGRFFRIQYVYEQLTESLSLNANNMLGIDLGIDNLATCVPTNGTPFIMDGRKIKSINHRWNQEKARFQSISDKQGVKGGKTKRIYTITNKRNRRMNDQIKKTARYIINYCINNNIGTVVVGYNKGFKLSPSIGKINNQNLAQLPLGDLRLAVSYLCERYNMRYIEQEESYTSKSSYIDNDILPIYQPEQPYKGTFMGKRVYRGLYKSANGVTINADVNGALNILRKANGGTLPCRGFLANPKRIRLV